MLLILPAFTGVSIYHHICGTEGIHNISIFQKTSCEHENEKSDYCEIPELTNNSCFVNNHGQCSEFVNYLAIDSEFMANDKWNLKPSELTMSFHSTLHSKIIERAAKNSVYKSIRKNIESPLIAEISYIYLQSQQKNSDTPENI